MSFEVSVQKEDFSVDFEMRQLGSLNKQVGAIVSFVGCVRLDTPDMLALDLECYPGMSEAQIKKHINKAKTQWPIEYVKVIHRVGRLKVGEQIVLVMVGSQHRHSAFEAAEFLMDYLKHEAPFWKKQINAEQELWIKPKQSDADVIKKWNV